LEKILVQPPKGIPPRLLTDYIKNCQEAVASAKAAIGRSDYRHTSVLGHRLKGTGGAYGIPAITDMGSFMEQASLQNNGVEVQHQVARLEEYLSQIEIVSE